MDIPPHNGTLTGIFDIAEYLGLTHLWVHPSTGITIRLASCQLGPEWISDWGAAPRYSWLATKKPSQHTPLMSVYTRKSYEDGRKSPSILVTFLEHSKWGWQDLTPSKILELVALLEDRLQTPMRAPGTVGMKYVKSIVSEHHAQWLPKPEADLSRFDFTQFLVWGRKPTPDELSKKYLYYFDKNSSYPYVGKVEKFGTGGPTHFTDGREFDKKLPGMWHLEITHKPELDPRLPSPLKGLEVREWFPTAIVGLLIDKGYQFSIKEAVAFEKSQYVFKASILALWALRSEFERGTPERSAFKIVMNAIAGNTFSSHDSWEDRPDWYTMFVSCARNIVYRNIDNIAKQDNLYPIMSLTDSLMYLSDEPSPELVAPHMRYSDELGCYKLEFRMEMTDEVREILMLDSGPGKKIMLLRQIQERGN